MPIDISYIQLTFTITASSIQWTTCQIRDRDAISISTCFIAAFLGTYYACVFDSTHNGFHSSFREDGEIAVKTQFF